ncbi:hypothetical protein CSKR_100348 [Clonorchis sinensis]|uniref:Uncharacterized protein n=2 Tax=Clonorchis sinensis TaxID=79923 RepID=A0A8T1MIZ7_CLOSI|nr:hypothetical protein CSKR_100348 [Clonorchis sinensis]GAA54218.1 hypothetical protein CLF_112719 [Clonorchis sinensis]
MVGCRRHYRVLQVVPSFCHRARWFEGYPYEGQLTLVHHSECQIFETVHVNFYALTCAVGVTDVLKPHKGASSSSSSSIAQHQYSNTDAPLSRDYNLFESFIVKKRIEVNGTGLTVNLPQSFRGAYTSRNSARHWQETDNRNAIDIE